VIPLLPFLSVNAALGLRNLLHAMRQMAGPRGAARAGALAMAMFILTGGAVLFEVGGWRFKKPDEAVAIARYIHAAGCTGSVAFEQSWTAGGRLYLRECQLLEIEPERSKEADYFRSIAGRSDVEWLVIRKAGQQDPRAGMLLDAGFQVDGALDTPAHLVARRPGGPSASPRVGQRE
jgi:hypothetical protein